MLALSAGFLLVGPFLCLGFGFALLVLEMLWGRAALVVFAVSFDGMPDFKGSLLALLGHMFQAVLASYGMHSSMSRKGNCWDNAPTQSLWGSLKFEKSWHAGQSRQAA